MNRWLALLSFCLALPVQAEQFVKQGGYVVHYTALASTGITPEVARQFGIKRSGNYALLVLNAQRETAAGKTQSIPATASGTVRNLIGHTQELELRQAEEGGVHYLLAEFQALNQEYLTFALQITPQGAPEPIPLKFQQQFYND